MTLPASSPLAAQRATILAVDDTPENLSLLTDLLKDNYRILVAKSGERALKMASAEQKPDLILLDILMPDMDRSEF